MAIHPSRPHPSDAFEPQRQTLSALTRGSQRLRRLLLGTAGIIIVIGLWWAAVTACAGRNLLVAQFSPVEAFKIMPALIGEDRLFVHVAASLRRIAVGLTCALLVGVPLGFLIGRVKALDALLSPALQFLRMISPLAWMPIAVMTLGVGDRAVYFLLSFAAVWPIVMSTAAGVHQIDQRWLQLGESLAATRFEMMWHIFVPAIAVHVLTGVRLSIGILWIVLVPAEMLGVSSGLGYLILDTRDRLAYSELMAVVLIIGALGFSLDWCARIVYSGFSKTTVGL